MSILRAYAFKIDEHLSDKAFAKIPHAFPREPVPTVKVCKARLQALSGVKSIRYDCCINSCCCFAGQHKDLTECPYCNAARYIIDHKGKKKSRKVFNYLPFIPRLVAMYANPTKAKERQYRAFEHKHTAGNTSDIFDSHIYRRLLGKKVIINGSNASHEYFSDPRDIALGLSTDGFCPFRRRKATAWPLILFDYNLAPEIRFHGNNVIGLGAIPGPKKPKDFDSFAWPAFEEFMRLQHGVRAFDVLADEFFLLRGYLLLVFGDIPAMSMVMRMTGHNGFSPCRMCKILGVRIPASRNNKYYVPLDRSSHPTVTESNSAIAIYDAAHLPLRTEEEMLYQAREVRNASSKGQKGRLSKAYGINGVSILSNLKSLCFPLSFPYDFMHLIWENLIPNLVLLWTGEFKGLDEGDGEYQFNSKVWQAIGEATVAAGSTIPSVFGAQPPNPATNKSSYSAEAWSFWTLYLGPVLLRRRFHNQRYYKHFIQLVRLLQMCLQFEITTEEVQIVRSGFIAWVKDYER
jgi:Transposase family tnp2